MRISEIIDTLEAKAFCGNDFSIDIKTACGSDLMSDVLAFVKEQGMLLTGLLNPQAIRTAEMLDMRCVVFVRGKEPTQMMIDLADSCGIVLLSTKLLMFTACGRLYSAGLEGGRN